MNGLWLENQKILLMSDLPRPTPADGEALIKVRLAGICSTDLEMQRGYYPFRGVMGHEFVGEVVLSPGQPGWEGKRVVGDINIACGRCAMCLSGRPHHCEKRKTLGLNQYNGCFSDHFILPVANLYEVPKTVPDEIAVFSEPLAAALEIREQVHILPGMKVLVVGAGRAGLLIALTLSLTGCDLQVVARHTKSREILETHHIATIGESDVKPHQADVVVDATGSSDGFSVSRKAVRPAGTLVLKSTFAGLTQINLSSIVVDEISLVGSRCGPHPAALRLMEKKAVDPRPLIDEIFPLTQGLRALEDAGKPGALKILLKPEG